MIDSHHHLWTLGQGPYEFPKPDDPLLYRDVTVDELALRCDEAGVMATVAVQTSAAVWETELLLALASTSDLIAGVVGWCDLMSADVANTLDRIVRLGPLVGVRPMLQRFHSAAFMLTEAADAGLAAVAARGLVFDALVDSRHLAVVDTIAARHPDLAIVVDHMAKPWLPISDFAAWTGGMQALSRRPNCAVKVSGFPFDVRPSAAANDYDALCWTLHGWFGRERLMWGTDWPLLERHASYSAAAEAVARVFPATDIDLIGEGNARRVYQLAA